MPKNDIANKSLSFPGKVKLETTTAKTATGSAVTSSRRKRPPKPVSESLHQYLTRREMLAVVPLCMATIDTLEKAGIFPKRIVLSPTRRVVWVRKEVEGFVEDRARNRDKGIRPTHERAQASENA